MSTDATINAKPEFADFNKYDFRNDEKYVFKARKGIDADRARAVLAAALDGLRRSVPG